MDVCIQFHFDTPTLKRSLSTSCWIGRGRVKVKENPINLSALLLIIVGPRLFFQLFQWKHKFHFWVFLHVNKWENHIGQKNQHFFTNSFFCSSDFLDFWFFTFSFIFWCFAILFYFLLIVALMISERWINFNARSKGGGLANASLSFPFPYLLRYQESSKERISEEKMNGKLKCKQNHLSHQSNATREQMPSKEKSARMNKIPKNSKKWSNWKIRILGPQKIRAPKN